MKDEADKLITEIRRINSVVFFSKKKSDVLEEEMLKAVKCSKKI
jgi:hypothetical protein